MKEERRKIKKVKINTHPRLKLFLAGAITTGLGFLGFKYIPGDLSRFTVPLVFKLLSALVFFGGAVCVECSIFSDDIPDFSSSSKTSSKSGVLDDYATNLAIGNMEQSLRDQTGNSDISLPRVGEYGEMTRSLTDQSFMNK